jgi:hypothetical protein
MFAMSLGQGPLLQVQVKSECLQFRYTAHDIQQSRSIAESLPNIMIATNSHHCERLQRVEEPAVLPWHSFPPRISEIKPAGASLEPQSAGQQYHGLEEEVGDSL